jgi:outer membrane protein OmpA-like peptidoglycan-associated protein
MFRLAKYAVIWLTISTVSAFAQSNPFEGGWTMESNASSLRFQSVKNQSKIESSTFATLSGDIADDGSATIKVLLDSVDTKVDLRNVRMRFLFFETFQYPEATVTMQIDPSIVSDLAEVRRKVVKLPYTIDLHGITKTLEADLALTLIGDDLVAVSTNDPITISVADFNLLGGLEKLQDAANVAIIPSSTVTFDFIFKKNVTGTQPVQTATATQPAKVALEAEGDFSLEACLGRFEILSRTSNIFFAPGSARLDAKSAPLLNTVVDVVQRCPDLVIQVAGHTDSKGGNAANQALSERRAASVATFLRDKGIDGGRVLSVGFGEARPVATNDTSKGRARNRRIEFAAANG